MWGLGFRDSTGGGTFEASLEPARLEEPGELRIPLAGHAAPRRLELHVHVNELLLRQLGAALLAVVLLLFCTPTAPPLSGQAAVTTQRCSWASSLAPT